PGCESPLPSCHSIAWRRACQRKVNKRKTSAPIAAGPVALWESARPAGSGRMAFPAFDAALAALLATVLVAGLAKGLSGFGSGMIVAPIAGALYGPQAALVIVVLIDSLPTVPITIPALPLARWREVL